MTRNNTLGYWVAQEQYSMANLFEFVKEAERCGFTTAMTSDHFHPWWHDNGYGNFTWIWIAAAAERTKKIQFVTGVTAAVYRYNPAVIAQAFASLDILYPKRIGLGIGTGEAMNEVSLGFEWPDAKVRLDRTTEAIQIIRKLWKKDGEDNNKDFDNDGFLNFIGKYFKIRNAKLYSPPSQDIPLYMAAVGEQSIKTAAKYSDGIITVVKPNKAAKIFDVFDKEAKENKRELGSLEKIAEYKVSFSEDYDEAFESTKFWRATAIENAFNLDINDPRELERRAKEEVPDEKLKESIQIITSIEDTIKPIEEYFEMGFTRVYIHSSSPNEIKFIQEFSKKVLTYF
jgi:coenzyme F420-dependent glucose-6-phosphate dehydrogenase